MCVCEYALPLFLPPLQAPTEPAAADAPPTLDFSFFDADPPDPSVPAEIWTEQAELSQKRADLLKKKKTALLSLRRLHDAGTAGQANRLAAAAEAQQELAQVEQEIQFVAQDENVLENKYKKTKLIRKKRAALSALRALKGAGLAGAAKRLAAAAGATAEQQAEEEAEKAAATAAATAAQENRGG